MTRFLSFLCVLMLMVFSPMFVGAQVPAKAKPPVYPSPTEIVAAAPAADWADIAVNDLLVMDLAADAKGHLRRVIIQLIPAPFSQGWVGNIRKLAQAHWWDGTSINRAQDNYVVQWGDPNSDDPKLAKTLPEGLVTMTVKDYPADQYDYFGLGPLMPSDPVYSPLLRGGHEDPNLSTSFHSEYYESSGFSKGWAVVSRGYILHPIPQSGRHLSGIIWPTHCYGMVGVGRNLPPDTGTGAELYVIIGQAPRQLDRNIALVGRVVEGMENLSTLPRGHGALGFYDLAKGDERVPILSVRLASDLPAVDQPHLQYLSTESASFAKYVDARANRRDPFYIQPAGGVDICNVPVPVRHTP